MYINEAQLYQLVIVVFFVVGGIITYLFLSIIRQHKKHLLLYEENIRKEITTLETIRNRVAADLHDDLGPMLAATKYKFSGLQNLDGQDKEGCRQGLDLIDEMVNKLRQIANDLMPSSLVHLGLEYAMKEFVQQVSGKSQLSIKFFSEKLPELANIQSLHIYRVLLEIIHNCIKHSGASKLKIELYIKENKLFINTAENGVGFDYDNKLKTGTGMGLQNIQARIAILGGNISVKSKAGQGVKSIITIPL